MHAHKKHSFYSFLMEKKDVVIPTDMIFLFKILSSQLIHKEITADQLGMLWWGRSNWHRNRARLSLATLPMYT